jgi:hypothetical protein
VLRLWLILVLGCLLALPAAAGAVTATGVFQGANQVTSFDFPTSSASGTSSRVRSPDLTLRIASASVPAGNTWRVHVSVLSTFTGPGGATIASSQLAVQGAAQGTGWATLAAQQTAQAGIASTTLSSSPFRFRFIPPAGIKAGDYTGSLRLRAQQYSSTGVAGGTSDISLSATIHVLGNIVILDVINATSDVSLGDLPGGSVSAITFPTQGTQSGRKVRSDSLRVSVSANTPWDLFASIDAPFTKLGDVTQTKPVTSFGVCQAPCSTISNFTSSGQLVQIANAVGTGNPVMSPLFQFVSRSVGGEAGTYDGAFTLTITVD